MTATQRDLDRLPKELQEGAEAASALALARSIDQGLLVASSARQLAALMAGLRTRAREATPVEPSSAGAVESKGAGIGDLSARIAARRDAAAG